MPRSREPIELADDPLALAADWLEAARGEGLPLPEAIAVATATADGAPDVRFLLLKEVGEGGMLFYTNSGSAKARQIAGNGRVATVLYWREIGRQVRTRGPVEEMPRDEVASYFATRPRDSQVGAWASRQSQPLRDMGELREMFEREQAKFEGGDVPLPEFWTGYRHQPLEVEFWREGDDRLHERVLYSRRGIGDKWLIERLFP